ncbi:excinuclease ABC subunit C [bacterium]|nr:excinuclease ABC subunit C [bacterium]MBP5591808.1 excinuclease ABC subunit C [bacterium]
MENIGNSYIIDENLLKKLPETPGVYQFKNKLGKVIYIGKAKNLKARVSQYISGTDSRPMVESLMKKAGSVEIILTNSETEALVLENLLIKNRQPLFNIDLKDDKTYPYLAVTDEEWPRLISTRHLSRKLKYFRGPFTQVNLLNSLKKLIQTLYPLKYCSNKRPKGCINFELGLCPAPCRKDADRAAYLENVKNTIEILQGKKWNEISRIIQEKIVLNAEALNFEKAAKLRDLLELLPDIRRKYSVEFSGSGAEDFFCFKRVGDTLFAAAARYSEGKLLSLKSCSASGIFEEMSSWTATFLTSFYSGKETPDKIFLFPETLTKDEISAILQRKIRKTGAAGGEILKMLQTNIEQNIRVFFNDTEKTNKALSVISKFLKTPVSSIQCLDISTLYGEYNVAGAVWWENGKFNRQKYRKYKIKTVKGVDDFGSLREVATRLLKRWQENSLEKPSLLLIDGGEGQVSSVKSVIQDFVPVAGIIKDRHNVKEMELLIDGSGNELVLQDAAFAMLLKAIRNETHRFSITFNREQRKERLELPFSKIKGIGRARENALLEKFRTIDAIKKATVQEIAEIPGITEELAEEILKALE